MLIWVLSHFNQSLILITYFPFLKKRKKLTPTGFSIGQTNLYLSNSDGNIIVINLTSGNLSTIEKASRDLISRPYIYNGDLFVVKNGSVIQYD